MGMTCQPGRQQPGAAANGLACRMLSGCAPVRKHSYAARMTGRESLPTCRPIDGCAVSPRRGAPRHARPRPATHTCASSKPSSLHASSLRPHLPLETAAAPGLAPAAGPHTGRPRWIPRCRLDSPPHRHGTAAEQTGMRGHAHGQLFHCISKPWHQECACSGGNAVP